MAIPKQVEEAGKKADEMLKAQNEPEPAKTDEPTDPPKADDPPVKPVEPSRESDAEKLSQRVKVIQGMLDKRNDEYRNMERTLNADIVQRDREIAELKSRIAELEKKPDKPAAVDVKAMLTEEQLDFLEEEGVSPQALEVMASMFSNMAANQVKPIEDKINTVDQNAQVSRQEAFINALHREVPDWVQINDNPDFRRFLVPVIPGVGVSRQEIINGAEAKLDPRPVIEILKEFKELYGKKPAEPGKKPNKMEDQVEVIQNSPNIPANDVSGQKIYTAKEVNEFYAQAASSGLAWKNPEAYKAQDQAIQKAIVEGRYKR